MARTIVYVDGFNPYYRALKGTPHKWLDIEAMSCAALPDTASSSAAIGWLVALPRPGTVTSAHQLSSAG